LAQNLYTVLPSPTPEAEAEDGNRKLSSLHNDIHIVVTDETAAKPVLNEEQLATLARLEMSLMERHRLPRCLSSGMFNIVHSCIICCPIETLTQRQPISY